MAGQHSSTACAARSGETNRGAAHVPPREKVPGGGVCGRCGDFLVKGTPSGAKQGKETPGSTRVSWLAEAGKAVVEDAARRRRLGFLEAVEDREVGVECRPDVPHSMVKWLLAQEI